MSAAAWKTQDQAYKIQSNTRRRKYLPGTPAGCNHSETLQMNQNVPVGSLDPGIDANESSSNLETSVKHKRSRILHTWDAAHSTGEPPVTLGGYARTHPSHPHKIIRVNFTFTSIRKQNCQDMTHGEHLVRWLQVLYIHTRQLE